MVTGTYQDCQIQIQEAVHVKQKHQRREYANRHLQSLQAVIPYKDQAGQQVVDGHDEADHGFPKAMADH